MYNRTPSPKTQDPVSNDTTQKRVSHDSTQVPVVEKSNPIDFIQSPVSVDTTQNPAPASSSLFVSQLPDFTTRAPPQKLHSSVTNQDLESPLTMQTIEKDCIIQDLNVSSPSCQVTDKKTTSTDQELTTLSSTQSIRNDIALNTDSNYGTRDTNITGGIFTDNVNEEAVPIQTTKKGKQKTRSAPVIKTRESRKRRSTAKVNYREQIDYDAILVDEAENPTEKPAEQKPAEIKPPKRKLIERESIGKEHEEDLAQMQEKRPKRQKKLSTKSEQNKESSSDAVKVDGRRKNKRKDEDEETEDMPRKKVARSRRTKAEVEKEEKEKENEDKAEKEDEERKVDQLLRSRTSFLAEANLRELIPQWYEALPEEDRLGLAPLLPEHDCGVNVGGLHHLYEAADQWQIMLSLGGFEDEPEAPVLTDSFKDENYERNWGKRVSRDQKMKARARPKKYK